jgi:hypothetical protein
MLARGAESRPFRTPRALSDCGIRQRTLEAPLMSPHMSVWRDFSLGGSNDPTDNSSSAIAFHSRRDF